MNLFKKLVKQSSLEISNFIKEHIPEADPEKNFYPNQIIFNGLQEDINHNPVLALFTDLVTGSTLSIPVKDFCKQNLCQEAFLTQNLKNMILDRRSKFLKKHIKK